MNDFDMQTSYVNNVLSEYIGSHIFQSIGIPTHETLLGVIRRDGERLAVACKDFCEEGYELHPFGWFMLNPADRAMGKLFPTKASDGNMCSVERGKRNDWRLPVPVNQEKNDG